MFSQISQIFKQKKKSARPYTPALTSNTTTTSTAEPVQESVVDTATLLLPLPEPSNDIAEGSFFLWTAVLPTDIVFQVIDNELLDDTPTLKSLASTCRLLGLHVRKHLLRRISVLRSGNPYSSNIKRFLLLIRQSPDILGVIESLNIDISTVPHPTISVEQHNAERDCICFLMKQSLPSLVNLRLTLNLSGFTDYTMEPSFSLYQAIISIFGNQRLRCLTLRGFDGFWMSLLSYAPHVLDLNIQNLQQNYGAAGGAKIQPKSLTVYDPSPDKSALVLDPQYGDLTQVSVFRFYGSHKSFMYSYVKQFSSTLTRLEIYISRAAENGQYIPHTCMPFVRLMLNPILPDCISIAPTIGLNLSSLNGLQHFASSIHMWVAEGHIRYESNVQFRWLTDTLASLPNPCAVKSIKIIIGCNVLHHCHIFDWATFDSSIFGVHQKWAVLEKLQFVFFLTYERDLNILGTEFRDVLLPKALQNFSSTNACLTTTFETGMSLHSYLPLGMR